VYCNQVNTTSGEIDVRVRFGISELSDEGQTTIEDQVDVMLTPIMVVKLRNLLTDIIRRHYPPLDELLSAEKKTE
jgi:hypothetical protein